MTINFGKTRRSIQLVRFFPTEVCYLRTTQANLKEVEKRKECRDVETLSLHNHDHPEGYPWQKPDGSYPFTFATLKTISIHNDRKETSGSRMFGSRNQLWPHVQDPLGGGGHRGRGYNGISLAIGIIEHLPMQWLSLRTKTGHRGR